MSSQYLTRLEAPQVLPYHRERTGLDTVSRSSYTQRYG
jgi:hypothetical protein